MSEERLVESFIRSDASPEGKWFVEVPVGLSIQEKKESDSSLKFVDAVCLTTQNSALPESYPDGPDFYFNVQEAEPHISKAEVFRRLQDSNLLSNEDAVIVEAKTGMSSFKSIGQLEAYKYLLEEDYGWAVQEQVLLSKKRDPVIDNVCTEKEYRVVNVST